MRIATLVTVVACAACGSSQSQPSDPSPAASAEPVVVADLTVGAVEGAAERPATPIADRYREPAARIIEAALADDGGWKKLSHLTDRIGNRLSGSPALERAVQWAVAEMKADGHENVRAEKVMVPHWVRGAESASLVAPVARPLSLLALGGSGGTPRRGIVADVLVVRNFDELTALGTKVKGTIVLFNWPMPPYTEEKGHGYGDAVAYRGAGPSRAAKMGAVGALVRSVTARSLRTPHTGATRWEDGQRPIPAAAVSIEDAELIARLAAGGDKVRVKLALGARLLPDVPSANVLGELRGSEKPDEIVVIGGHLDSWDVGQGAHDDGGGCVMAMQALTVLRRLGLTPRRTIRVVLFTNEENGVRGGDQYATDHAAELPRHVMAIESDSGSFAPQGFQIEKHPAALARVSDIVTLLAPIDAARAKDGHSGTDIEPLGTAGVPLLGQWVEQSRYFDYHHSDADTLDKVDPGDLQRNIAAMAIMAYVVADMPERLGGEVPAATP